MYRVFICLEAFDFIVQVFNCLNFLLKPLIISRCFNISKDIAAKIFVAFILILFESLRSQIDNVSAFKIIIILVSNHFNNAQRYKYNRKFPKDKHKFPKIKKKAF